MEPRIRRRSDAEPRRTLQRRGRWWRRLEPALAVLLVALLAGYLLTARELFLTRGEPLTASSGPDPTPADVAVANTAARLDEADAAAGIDQALAGGNAARTGEFAGIGPRRVLRLLWSFPTGGEIVAEPVVAAGVVYVGSGDGILYALDAATGAIRWRFPTPGPITGAVAVADGVVYVVADGAALYAIETDRGRERWRRPLAAAAAADLALTGAAPLVAGDLIYLVGGGAIALADGRLYAVAGPATPVVAIETVTGEERWTARPVTHGLHALDPASGDPLWQLPGPGLAIGIVAVAEGVVFAADAAPDAAGLLVTADAATGAARWAALPGQGVPTGLAIAGGRALLATAVAAEAPEGGGLFAILTAGEVSGDRLNWRSAGRAPDPATAVRFTSRPIVAAGFVYAGSSEGALLALDLGSGQIRRRYNAGTPLGPPTVAGGVLYVGGRDGRLFAIGGDPGEDATAAATTATAATAPPPGPIDSPAGTPTGAAAAQPASTGLNVTSAPANLRYLELLMAADTVAIGAGDAAAIDALETSLATNLRSFRPGGCQPVVVVIAVGAIGQPEVAIKATSAIEDALRATHPPIFATVEILTIADAATPVGQIRVRVYHVPC